MNILLIAENWPPRVGGIENYLTHIARYLPPNDVTVIAPKASVTEELKGIKVIRKRFFWPVIKPAWLPLWWSLYRQTKNEKIDVVLCGKALFEGLIGYYLKKHFNIPYVVFTYAMEIETWKKSNSEFKKLKKVLINADKVVCINEVTKKALLEMGVKETQLVKIWPGVDSRFLQETKDKDVSAVLKKYEIEKPYVLTVARLIKRKGTDTLIEAFADLDQTKFGDVQLIVAGEGPEKENLEQLSQNLWIDTTVKFIGAVDDKDLPALYKGALLYALTPRNIEGDIEGFGIVYLEANASGTPVLGTNSGGVPEAVKDNESGILVEPDSPTSTRKALEKLLGDKKLLSNLGNKGRKRVQNEFQWDTRIKELTKVLQEIVK